MEKVLSNIFNVNAESTYRRHHAGKRPLGSDKFVFKVESLGKISGHELVTPLDLPILDKEVGLRPDHAQSEALAPNGFGPLGTKCTCHQQWARLSNNWAKEPVE